MADAKQRERATLDTPLLRETITEAIALPPQPPATDEALQQKARERMATGTPAPSAAPVPAAVAPSGRFAVRVRTGHPTGVYRRAGMQFSGFADVFMDEVPDAIKNDDWLVVKEVTS